MQKYAEIAYALGCKYALATLKTELLPHQQRVLDRIQTQPGLVVAHGLGSGKTLTSIAAGLNEPGTTTALVPASLQENYQKEILKHVRGAKDSGIDVRSMQLAALRGEIPKSDLLIVDEAHRAREQSAKIRNTIAHANAARRLLLTASPVYNRPSDIAPLVNLAAGENLLPTRGDFNKKYVQEATRGWGALMPWATKEESLKNTTSLKKILRQWVDYHPSIGTDFPDRIDTRVSIPMTKRQTQLHDYAWGKLPVVSRMRLKAGLPASKKDLARLNAFQSQARQIATSENPFSTERKPIDSPKIMKAFELFQQQAAANPRHKAVMYSNFLGNLGDYKALLDRANIPHGVVTGEQGLDERANLVDAYNQDKLKALLVSSAGGEGLDLKGTRQVQVMEPHWNEEKLKQVIGRAIRHGSHAHLPADERSVDVQKFESHPQSSIGRRALSAIGLMDKTPVGVEQILYNLADKKEHLNSELLGLLKDPAQ